MVTRMLKSLVIIYEIVGNLFYVTLWLIIGLNLTSNTIKCIFNIIC